MTNSTTGARAANTAPNYNVLNHGACAAIAAGAGANNSTLGARAAITAGASAMCSTTGARSLQKLVRCAPPLEQVLRIQQELA